MSDLISRQAAIDALNDVVTITGFSNATAFQNYIRRVNNRLQELPSAQPNLQPTCNQLATDTISRQAAIDATWRETGYTDPINVATAIRDRIEALPSAQPEIIRCKDCEDYQTDWETDYPNEHYCATMDRMMSEDGFCCYAERRIDETD